MQSNWINLSTLDMILAWSRLSWTPQDTWSILLTQVKRPLPLTNQTIQPSAKKLTKVGKIHLASNYSDWHVFKTNINWYTKFYKK